MSDGNMGRGSAGASRRDEAAVGDTAQAEFTLLLYVSNFPLLPDAGRRSNQGLLLSGGKS